ncbi:MAG: rhomboid family intramembrane serine protease [Cyclobacteriaceae bacterium]|nr:rhomboid family intramembrane serine protease [Cyclobacteriaceae bacterium]
MEIRYRLITLSLILANLIVFVICRYSIGTFNDPVWTQGLLFSGAEFAPLTLDKEWYRIFTHMFLHGNLLHLAFNMYALFAAGSEVERITGPVKFLWICFLCGITASLASLYFNLFTIGVGASGAIFGLFGFSLVVQIAESRKEDRPIAPLITNFIIFLGVNLLYAKMLNADNAAHMGGLAGGLLLGAASLLNKSYQQIKAEYLLLVLSIAGFMMLPRYQVAYFNFFQSVLAVEDSARLLFQKKSLTDEDYLRNFKKYDLYWDSTRTLLDAQTYLPEALHQDTFRLRRYIDLRKEENNFRIQLLEKETYRYMDSIEWSQQQMQPYLQLDYVLTQLQSIRAPEEDTVSKPRVHPVKVWYNEEWEEIPGPPAAFYRLGQQDSLGRWQGPVRDYYNSGEVQMKGAYTDGRRDGVFLYYSDHSTYESAGRYNKEIPVGKWERFHRNGKLNSEEYFEPEYFMKNMWDSVGTPLVQNGEGMVKLYYGNGALSEQGEYRNGKKEGRWMGYHANGQTYFEEYFNNGQLVQGRSRTLNGQQFVYDGSSLFPIPEAGYPHLNQYLKEKVKQLNVAQHGQVKVWFRVTLNRVLTDFQIDKSLAPELDSLVIEWLRTGPQWLPARDHGHQMRSGWSTVTVEF